MEKLIRTTLDIEEDVLLAAKEIARQKGVTLGQLCEAPGHSFWTEDPSLLDILDPDAIITHTQITDVYLLGLAVHKKGKLATLNRRIPVKAAQGGRKALELIITRLD